MNRGGKRKGAGRPKLPGIDKRVKVSFTLKPLAYAKIIRRAALRQCSRSDVVQQWAEAIRE